MNRPRFSVPLRTLFHVTGKEEYHVAVFRIEKTRDYTVMANHHLKNRELTLKTKGLMSVMLSLPDDWDYTLKGLAHISREGVDAIREAVRELEQAGYIVRTRVRNEKGQLTVTEYVIYEQPRKPEVVSELPVPDSPALEKPILENPTLDNPALNFPALDSPTLDNPTQLNTHRTSTQKEKIEKINSLCSKSVSIKSLSINARARTASQPHGSGQGDCPPQHRLRCDVPAV